MTIRLISLALAFTCGTTAVALAQDYSAGKSPAQLFASDCSGCHKSPQGLAKNTDVRALAGFLREHYTTKQESAGALAAFVAAAGGAPATADRKPPAGRSSRSRASGAPVDAPAEEAAKPAPQRSAADEAAKPTQRAVIWPWETAKPETPEPEAVEDTARPQRRRAKPAGAKPEAQPSTPAIIRHQGGSRPATAARPAARTEKPAAEPSPKASEPAAKPTEGDHATSSEPAPSPSAPSAVEKLKSYLSSGEASQPSTGSTRPSGAERLNDYATSGDDRGAKPASEEKPAVQDTPAAKPADAPAASAE